MATPVPSLGELSLKYNLYCHPEVTNLIVHLYDMAKSKGIVPKFSEDAEKVLTKRYYLRDSDGEPFETQLSFLCRVAIGVQAYRVTVDSDDLIYDQAMKYLKVMADLDFLPGSPTLMNAGTLEGQLSACFVVPVDDSIDGIFDGVKSVAKIHKSGGGTGMDFSALRAEGSTVRSTGGVASGPVSFMKIYDAATEQIKQGGKRRGANMGMLRVDHPDIRKFIECKDDNVSLQNFNISVAVTKEFMDALYNDGTEEYALRDPKSGEVIGYEDAREIWQKLVHHAWLTGDPGIVFIDRINETQPFDVEKHPEHRIYATNPCGEQPLEPWEACNLGSINLDHFAAANGRVAIDTERLKNVIYIGVQMLDDVVSSSVFPLDEITQKVRANRKIGLGVMGWADLLMRLGIAYGSEESIAMAGNVSLFIERFGRLASTDLAKQKTTFPEFENSRYDYPMRNATITTIAPTGTLSMLANCSGGIEPVFALAYTKTVMDGTEFKNVHPLVEEAWRGGFLDEEDLALIKETGHADKSILNVFSQFVTAHDVASLDHVRMQAAWQAHTDNAVSKTVNLSSDAPVELVDAIYREAYMTGCKGITIFRDGCKGEQVLTTGTATPDPNKAIVLVHEEGSTLDIQGGDIPSVTLSKADYDKLVEASNHECSCHVVAEPTPRAKSLWGPTVKQPTPCGNMYVTITEDSDGKLQELFGKLGKGGGCAAANMEAVGRLASVAIRAGVDPEQIVLSLRDIGCGQQCGFGPNRVVSCLDAMGLVLQEHLAGANHRVLLDEEADEKQPLSDGPGAELKHDGPISHNGACPECGSKLARESGCAVCYVCSYSKCG